MSKIYVIAGTVQEAKLWSNANYQKRVASGDQPDGMNQYVYVDSATRVRGIQNPHGVFVGNWLGRPDILEIVEALMTASTHVNPALGKIYKDLQPKVRPTPKLTGHQITQAYVDEAALLMAQAIDAEVLRNLTIKINGGMP